MADVKIDEAQLFALAEQSSALGNGAWGAACDDDDDEDMEGTSIVQLDDGNYHVCRGMRCPHMVQSSEVDRSYTCKLSGRFISNACESAHDASWTGRSCSSADPDMQSGAAACPAWRNKRNAFSASAAAYKAASSMTIDDTLHGDLEYNAQAYLYDASATPFETNEWTAGKGIKRVKGAASSSTAADDADAKDVKRGAPCVVDVDDAAVLEQKRTKAARRIALLKEKTTQARLVNDASTVVVKLFSVLPTAGGASSSQAKAPSKKEQATAGAASTLTDPRLENYDFVLNMALKRYVARCKDRKEHASMSGIHDVCIAANQFVKQRRKEAKGRRAAIAPTSNRRIACNGKGIELCSQLIFALWVAMCHTPYFTEYQTGDSFRPFAAGVMYALKRGLRLPNNLVLVPAIASLADCLPTLRSSTATPAAKQLQQASHRGLCAISRGISSIDSMSSDDQQVALKQLQIVSSLATRLSNFVRENC